MKRLKAVDPVRAAALLAAILTLLMLGPAQALDRPVRLGLPHLLTPDPAPAVPLDRLTLTPDRLRLERRLPPLPAGGRLSLTLEDPAADGAALPLLTLTIDATPLPLPAPETTFLAEGFDVTDALTGLGYAPARLAEALQGAADSVPEPDALLRIGAALDADLRLPPQAEGWDLFQLRTALRWEVPLPPDSAPRDLLLEHALLAGQGPPFAAIIAAGPADPFMSEFCVERSPDFSAWVLRQRGWLQAMAMLGQPPDLPVPRVIGLLPMPGRGQPPPVERLEVTLDLPQGWSVAGCLPEPLSLGADGRYRVTLERQDWLEPMELLLLPPGGAEGLLPESAVRPLTRADVDRFITRWGKGAVRFARNEIFARRGYVFQDPGLQRFFSRQPWYRPIGPEVTLSPLEARNAEWLRRYE